MLVLSNRIQYQLKHCWVFSIVWGQQPPRRSILCCCLMQPYAKRDHVVAMIFLSRVQHGRQYVLVLNDCYHLWTWLVNVFVCVCRSVCLYHTVCLSCSCRHAL